MNAPDHTDRASRDSESRRDAEIHLDTEIWSRSPHMMSAGDTAFLIVDVQQKLVSLIPQHERIIWNLRRLLDGACALGVPVLATEQYPQGLGPTVPQLAQRLEAIPAKLSFSCAGCEPLMTALRGQQVHKLLIGGIETHVCVQQTVLDLLAAGMSIYVAVDAVGARGAIDHDTALRRMDSAGAVLTTTEAALFEWCCEAGTPQFKQISQLVREEPPSPGGAS